MRKSVFDRDQDSSDEDEPVPTAGTGTGTGKRKRMEMVLEVLKADPSLQDDCPPSTNLVIKPLDQSVDEHTLLAEFGRFGEVASIKIMWPRGDRPVATGNTGFVAFMRRDDAMTAMNTLGGLDFHGRVLSIGWADPVPLPDKPLNDQAAAVADPTSTREKLEDGPPPKAVVRGVGRNVVVKPPDTARARYVCDALAVYVARDGAEFEDAVKAREAGNPELSFLFDEGGEEGEEGTSRTYYTWRVWSLSNGDSLTEWRVEPFLMTKDGPLWIPPPLERSEAPPSAAVGDKPLDEASQARWRALLSDLTSERPSIAAAMTFAIDHAESCVEIVRSLSELATSNNRAMPERLAALDAISDILYNTTCRRPNASLYRRVVQDVAGDVWASLLSSPSATNSRLGRAAVSAKLEKFVDAWRTWNVVDDAILEALDSLCAAKRL